MGGTGGHHGKWNKVGVERETPHVLTYKWDPKELVCRSDHRRGGVQEVEDESMADGPRGGTG